MLDDIKANALQREAIRAVGKGQAGDDVLMARIPFQYAAVSKLCRLVFVLINGFTLTGCGHSTSLSHDKTKQALEVSRVKVESTNKLGPSAENRIHYSARTMKQRYPGYADEIDQMTGAMLAAPVPELRKMGHGEPECEDITGFTIRRCEELFFSKTTRSIEMEFLYGDLQDYYLKNDRFNDLNRASHYVIKTSNGSPAHHYTESIAMISLIQGNYNVAIRFFQKTLIEYKKLETFVLEKMPRLGIPRVWASSVYMGLAEAHAHMCEKHVAQYFIDAALKDANTQRVHYTRKDIPVDVIDEFIGETIGRVPEDLGYSHVACGKRTNL